MKKILILGANGRVGIRLVKLALDKKYLVTAIVRDSKNLDLVDSNLEIREANVLNQDELNPLIEGKDIIFTCLSGKKTKPDYSILSIPIFHILNQIETQRLILVAGAGILDDPEYGLRRNRPGYPEIFKLVSAENWKIYQALKETKVCWTMLCCPEMPDGEEKKNFRIEQNYLPKNGNRISTGDVAEALLSLVDSKNSYGYRMGIAY